MLLTRTKYFCVSTCVFESVFSLEQFDCLNDFHYVNTVDAWLLLRSCECSVTTVTVFRCGRKVLNLDSISSNKCSKSLSSEKVASMISVLDREFFLCDSYLLSRRVKRRGFVVIRYFLFYSLQFIFKAENVLVVVANDCGCKIWSEWKVIDSKPFLHCYELGPIHIKKPVIAMYVESNKILQGDIGLCRTPETPK